MHVRFALVVGLLPLAVALAGCTESLSSSNFELKPIQVGWRIGQDAIFLLKFKPEGAGTATYDLDPVFAVSEVHFEKAGLNVMGDYGTKRAADLNLAILRDGSPVENATLTSSNPTVQLRIKIPEALENGEYTLELRLFKVGWVESDLFRVAV